ncbi:hypothetical protein BV20DRAFT_1037878 [Pilatotrama ljubarskyi]|nr:hypothetical protein BV20DRAFT_1037878 [Pilatotrama ljubarskyi]
MADADSPLCERAFAEIFNRHVIYDRILDNCSPQNIFRLSRVRRQARHAVQDYTERVFNVNTRLSRFFRDPLAFRSLQACTATVISGSFALQFFDRSYFAGSDLDLYVHPDTAVLHVGEYLQSEGYEYRPCQWQLDDYHKEIQRLCETMGHFQSDDTSIEENNLLYKLKSVRAVYSFTKGGPDDSTRTVQIIVSRLCPMASILDFHSTCVMNAITYNTACSFYPIATYEQRMSLVINDSDPNAPAALEKYARRGWRSIANPSPLVPFLDSESGVFHFNTTRWACDSRSWTIHLSSDGVIAPPPASPSSVPLTWDPIVECSWILEQYGETAVPMYEKIATTVMRWSYTVGEKEYLNKLIKFFRRQGPIEHAKVPKGKSMQDCFDAWTWWDSVLPLFRRKYLEEMAVKA